MRRKQFFRRSIPLAVTVLILFSNALRARAAKTTVVVSVTKSHDYLLIIPVSIDGAGPYNFVVDTGSSITIVDDRLFHDLHLVAAGQQRLTGIASDGRQPKAMLNKLSVAGLSIEALPVVILKNLSTAFPGAAQRIDGILGEDFLCHYDLLIDNTANTISFDSGRELISELSGVRIPINKEGQIGSEVYQHRPMIKLDVPSYSGRPISALLDSGAQAVVLLPRDIGRMASRLADTSIITSITVLGGTVRCASWSGQLRSENLSFGEHSLTVCPLRSGQSLDNEGSLPTALFRSIFIAHRQAFVIFNPEKVAVQNVEHLEQGEIERGER